MEAAMNPFVDWAVASTPVLGQTESGDCYVVKTFPDGVLVAVVDGVGHGSQAAAAARLTVEVLGNYADGESLTALVEVCHERLRGTRGAVISLASFSNSLGAMTWLGVGNIEGLLVRSPSGNGTYHAKVQETLLLRAGVVGHNLPRLSAKTLPLYDGDLIVFATDGIRPEFADDIYSGGSPQQIAQHILNRHALETDDSLVLAVRYLHEKVTPIQS
jgi:negative regulator of sigma-B (phosphoserine phosphatase)